MIQELRRQEVREFILTHENDDPAALVLSASKYPDLPIQLIAKQIQSRQKAKSKLPTFYSITDLIYPPGISLEQSSSEATAEYKSKIIEGDSLTDLTGGFGIDAYFFSKQIKSVLYVEQSAELSELAAYNFQILQADQISVLSSSCQDYLQSEKTPTDIYYLDPARRDQHNKKLIEIKDLEPNVFDLLPALLKRGATVLIKFSPMLDLQTALVQLPHVQTVHVVAVKNECKELIYLIQPEFDGEPAIVAVNLDGQERESILFKPGDEMKPASFAMPERYLYEPNAAIMKAGAFNFVSRQYGVNKLHRNSHLYTSQDLLNNFPGRYFEIEQQLALNKKALKKAIPSSKANITVRNHPLTVSQIRQKTGIKEGGDNYLFATTLMDGKPSILLCKKVNSPTYQIDP